jgi:short-subunit dehydrogenase
VTPLDFTGRWVVVTGASSGLGEAFAHELARRGAHLVLVARRERRLQELCRELERSYGNQADLVALDLSEADAAERLFRVATNARSIHALVSNAGTHWFGDAWQLPEDASERMLRLNALTPIALLRRFLPYFEQHAAGGALVVTSTGALMPTPWQALYGGSKALLHQFVQGLQYERGGEAARVALCLCCPGGMPTELLMGSEVRERIENQKLVLRTLLEPRRVAERAVQEFAERRLLIVPGRLNQLMILLSRVLPAGTVGRGATRVYAAR